MARHPGGIYRIATGWRVVLQVEGVRHQFGPRTNPELAGTKAQCPKHSVEEWAARKYTELLRQAQRHHQGLPGPMRLSALIEKYKAEVLPTVAESTKDTYEHSLSAFTTFLATNRDAKRHDPLVAELRAPHVAEFLHWRRSHRPDGKAATTSERTCAKDRAVLSALFSYAQRLELREGNPVRTTAAPRPHARQPVILDEAQYEALLGQCADDPMLSLFVLTLGESGLRCESEALALRWEDLELDEGFLHIRSSAANPTKGRRSRYVPVTARLARALREHMLRFRAAGYGPAEQPSAFVFHHLWTRRHAVAGGRIKSLRGGFKGAARRAELPAELHQHDMRHRRVTTWLAEGRDVVLVKEAVGHADLKTTMGYSHLSKLHLRKLVERPEPRDRATMTGR